MSFRNENTEIYVPQSSRIADARENAQTMNSDNEECDKKYLGLVYNEKTRRYTVHLTYPNQNILSSTTLGSYVNPVVAAKKYDAAILFFYKDADDIESRINFHDSIPAESKEEALGLSFRKSNLKTRFLYFCLEENHLL